jgi:DNA repair protein RadC
LALAENAANVIVAHNHPSGNALPSNADRELTSRIEAALSAIGITLIEHIIVGEVGYTPTMQIRISSLRSPLSTSELDNGFLRKFYNE